MPMKNIYLDHAATTPLDSRVLKAMTPYFTQHFGNPSSVHSFGQNAAAGLERARAIMAQYLHCQPSEVVFTSCGSESDNLALRGAALTTRQERGANHLLISPIEHPAILRTAQQLQDLFGFELEFLPVDKYGRVTPAEVAKRIRPETAVVSVMYANNEVGTLNPIAKIGEICREASVLFHTDAVQAVAHLPANVQKLNVALLSIGAHKFYGPKGVGALYVRDGTTLIPSQAGGAQEFGLRAGTENVPYLVGMAEAFRLVQIEHSQRSTASKKLRDRIIARVLEEIPHAKLTGHPSQRLPNHASFALKNVDGNLLVAMLDARGFACSSGSACKTGNPKPSGVLTALGYSPEWTKGGLRVTVGKDTTSDDVEAFLDTLPDVVALAREM
ncbi:MAG: cysteine desulfurase NifS [Chloroflexota bacterium]|nr:MAG: cysteine desulfurase NifS [Chloroflexota bacterium]